MRRYETSKLDNLVGTVVGRHRRDQLRRLFRCLFLMGIVLGILLTPSASIGAEDSLSIPLSTVSLAKPILPDVRPRELAYASNEQLLVVREADPPIRYGVIEMSSEGQILGDWPSPPENLAWRPQTVVGDRRAGSVYFSRGDASVYVYDAGRKFIDSWYGRPRENVFPERVRVGPTGDVFGSIASGGGTTVHRWRESGDYRGFWTVDTEYSDLIIDSENRALMIQDRSEGSSIWRYSESGREPGEVKLAWPQELGPLPSGQAPLLVQSLTADKRLGELLAFHIGRTNHSSHVLRYTNDGAFVSATQLWRLDPRYHPRPAFIEPSSDGGYAIAWTPDSRIDPIGTEDHGVTQFDAQGRIQAVTRMSSSGRPVGESWDRVRLAGSGGDVVLFPHAGVISQVDRSGSPLWARAAPPFAVDLDVGNDGVIAVRGWDGVEGTLSLYDTDRSRLWSAQCDCALATGLALDSRQIFVSNPISRSIEVYNRSNGQYQYSVSPTGAPAGWPVDIASIDDGRLVTVDEWAGIQIWEVGPKAAIQTHEWRLRNATKPVAIDGRDGVLAVLMSDGVAEVWSGDGEFTARLVSAGSDEQAVDISLNHDSTVSVVESTGPEVRRYALAHNDLDNNPSIEAGDRCSVTGDKQALPSTIPVGEIITVTLALDGKCRNEMANMDVMIAWDPGSSFWYDYEYARATEAIQQLIEALDSPEFRVGVVAVAEGATGAQVLVPLDLGTKDALDRVREFRRVDFGESRRVLDGSSVWPDMLGVAVAELKQNGRLNSKEAIVFVGQGLPETSRAPASMFSSRGGSLLALQIPFGCELCLRDIVDTDSDVVFGAHASDVAVIARRLRGVIAPHEVRGVRIEDRIAAEFVLLANTVSPPADVSADTVTWHIDRLGPTAHSFTYRLQAIKAGRFATSLDARAKYTEADGISRSYVFPKPVVNVFGPSPTATPSMTAQPSATQKPSAIYLPLILNESCKKELRRVDVVMILDASTSMLEPTSAGRSKLDAALEAALALVDELDFAAGDQGGLVVFNERVTGWVELSGSRRELAEALDGVTASPGTCIPCGTREAVELLFGPRRNPLSAPALVLLTDGFSNIQPIGDAIPIAEQAKERGAEIFTIGLGEAVEEDALRQIASGDDKYFATIDAEALRSIFQEIVREIPCPVEKYWGRR